MWDDRGVVDDNTQRERGACGPAQFVPVEVVAALFASALPIDHVRFRADLERGLDGRAKPRT